LGAVKNANLVENYPGFPGGISGSELLQLFREHAVRLSVRVTFEEIKKLSFDGRVFQAVTSQGDYQSRVAVIASGTKQRPLTDLAVPAALCDRVEYEVFSLLDLRGQEVAIIGAGDGALITP
jgi:thioredoxin reductase (NADPH)